MAGRAYFEPSDEARAQLKGQAFFFSGALEVLASPPPVATPPPSSPKGFELIDAAADSENPPCPDGWIQYPACSDALGCGLNPNCGKINTADSIDDCGRQCLDNPECHTIEWSSTWMHGGAAGNACNLNAESAPTTRWCGPFVFCGLPLPPPPPPPPLPPPNPSPAKCPDDFVQYPACSDVPGCGYSGCSPWNTGTSIKDCAAQCREDSKCHTFEWLGDGQYAGMCNLNEEWTPTTEWCYEGTFLFCGKPVPPPAPPSPSMPPSLALPPPSPSPVKCPDDFVQYPACSDVPGCGYSGCSPWNTGTSIEDCAAQCREDSKCHTFEWLGDGQYAGMCNLNEEWTPTTEWCYDGTFLFCGEPVPSPSDPPPPSPSMPPPVQCPDDFVQYPACSDVMGCGLTGCDPLSKAASIEDCAAQCRQNPKCHTFEWFGDGQYASMCHFNEEWAPNTEWCYDGTFLFCGKPVPPSPLAPPTPRSPMPPPMPPLSPGETWNPFKVAMEEFFSAPIVFEEAGPLKMIREKISKATGIDPSRFESTYTNMPTVAGVRRRRLDVAPLTDVADTPCDSSQKVAFVQVTLLTYDQSEVEAMLEAIQSGLGVVTEIPDGNGHVLEACGPASIDVETSHNPAPASPMPSAQNDDGCSSLCELASESQCKDDGYNGVWADTSTGAGKGYCTWTGAKCVTTHCMCPPSGTLCELATESQCKDPEYKGVWANKETGAGNGYCTWTGANCMTTHCMSDNAPAPSSPPGRCHASTAYTAEHCPGDQYGCPDGLCVFLNYAQCKASETKETCGPWCHTTGKHVCEWREDAPPPSPAPRPPPPTPTPTPQYSFKVIKSGDCPSNGLEYIDNYCECGVAGDDLGVGGNREYYEETQGFPSGNRQKYCGTWAGLGHLHFNSQTSGDLNGYPILQKAGTSFYGPTECWQICKTEGSVLPSKCATPPPLPEPPQPPPPPFDYASPPPPFPNLPAPPLFSQGWCPEGHPRCPLCPICHNCTFLPGTCLPGWYGLHLPSTTTSACFKPVNVTDCGKDGVFASMQEIVDFYSTDHDGNIGDDVPCIGMDTGMHTPMCGLPPSKFGLMPTANGTGWYPIVYGSTPDEFKLIYAGADGVKEFPSTFSTSWESGVIFALCRRNFEVSPGPVPSPPSTPPAPVACGFDKIGLTPNWQFSTSGGGTWLSSASTIRFDFDNDLKCGGLNGNIQSGTAHWTFTLVDEAVITLSMEGMAESQFETFTLVSDGITVTEVQASNGEGGSTCQVHTCNMCPVSMPSTPLSLTAGDHTLRVDVTTIDGMYQNSAYFQITFSVEGVCDGADTGTCPDGWIGVNMPSPYDSELGESVPSPPPFAPPPPPSPPPSPPPAMPPPPACDWEKKADEILNGGGGNEAHNLQQRFKQEAAKTYTMSAGAGEDAESLQQRLIQEQDGEAAYQVVKSGDCPSNGLEYITAYCECGVAGDALGVGGNKEHYEETQGFPSGNRQKYCGTWAGLSWLHFNSQTSGDLNGYPIIQQAGTSYYGPTECWQICKMGGTALPSKCATVQSPYEVIKSGDCPSKGLAYITDYCECAIAGRVLGVGINKEKYEETQGFPSGNRQKYCGTWGHMGHLHFNSQTSGSMGGYPILQKAGHDVAGPSPTFQICKKGGKKGGDHNAGNSRANQHQSSWRFDRALLPTQQSTPNPIPQRAQEEPSIGRQGAGTAQAGNAPRSSTLLPLPAPQGTRAAPQLSVSSTSGCFKPAPPSEKCEFASQQEIIDFFSVDRGSPYCVGVNSICNAPAAQSGYPAAQGWYPIVDGGKPSSYRLMYAEDDGVIKEFDHTFVSEFTADSRFVLCKTGWVTPPGGGGSAPPASVCAWDEATKTYTMSAGADEDAEEEDAESLQQRLKQEFDCCSPGQCGGYSGLPAPGCYDVLCPPCPGPASATASSPYEIINSGDCPSNGLEYITDYCECGVAGDDLGVGGNREYYEETQGFPSGNRQKYCGTWGDMGHLHFNSQTSGDLNGYPILQKAGQDVAGPSPTYQICKKGFSSMHHAATQRRAFLNATQHEQARPGGAHGKGHRSRGHGRRHGRSKARPAPRIRETVSKRPVVPPTHLHPDLSLPPVQPLKHEIPQRVEGAAKRRKDDAHVVMGFQCYNITDTAGSTNKEAHEHCTSSCQSKPETCAPYQTGSSQSGECECHMCVARPMNFMGLDSEDCNRAYLLSAKIGHNPNIQILSLACCCVGLARIGLTEPETWESCQKATHHNNEGADWMDDDDYLPCDARPGNGIGATKAFCNQHYVMSQQMGVPPNPTVMSEGCCCNGYGGESKESCEAVKEEASKTKCVARPGNELNLDDDYCNTQYETTVAKGQAPNGMIMSSCCCAGFDGETEASCGLKEAAKVKRNAAKAKAKGKASKTKSKAGREGKHRQKNSGAKRGPMGTLLSIDRG